MGNNKSKEPNKLQKDLNDRFENNQNQIDDIFKVKIENSQHRKQLNENYDFVLEFFQDEFLNFQDRKQVMLQSNILSTKRIQKSLIGLFDIDQKDSLPQIFQEYKLSDKCSMKERQKLIIFYHISVLEKYYHIKILEINQSQSFKNYNEKISGKNEQQKKNLRKNLRKYSIEIIKGQYPFVFKPILKRFNQIMQDGFYRDFKDKSRIIDEKSLYEFQQKLINRLTKDEADFIFISFSFLTIALTQIVQYLLQRLVTNMIPNIFSGCQDLYQSIFCGQIVEKLLFTPRNKILFLAAVEVHFNKTNKMKDLDIGCNDKELVEILKQTSFYMQQSLNPFSVNERNSIRYSTLVFQASPNNNNINRSNTLNNNLHSYGNTLKNVDLNKASSAPNNQNNHKNGNERSNNSSKDRSNITIDKKQNKISDYKFHANIHLIKQFSNTRESFVVRNGPGVLAQQISQNTFSNISEHNQEDFHSNLDCIQEEECLRGNKFAESIFSENFNYEENKQDIIECLDESEKLEENKAKQQELNESNKIKTNGETGDNYLINKSNQNSKNYQVNNLQQEQNKQLYIKSNQDQKDSDSQKINYSQQLQYLQNQLNAIQLDQNISNEMNLQDSITISKQGNIFQSQKLYQNIENILDKNIETFNDKTRDTICGKTHDTLNEKTRDTIHKISIEHQNNRHRATSQTMKNHLQDKYKIYLNEIYNSLENCLSEPSLFKKIKKAFKFVVKIQDRFVKNSVNQNSSYNYLEEKSNWYNIIEMIFQSFLSFKPECHKDIYILSSTINLLSSSYREATHLQDLQYLLQKLLKVNECNEDDRQSQVSSLIQYSLINNIEDTQINDDQLDFICKNSTIQEFELNQNSSSILNKSQYQNVKSIICENQ